MTDTEIAELRREAFLNTANRIIPPRYQKPFEPLTPAYETIIAQLNAWAAFFKPGVTAKGLYLYGPKTGCGKTHAAYHTLREVALRGFSIEGKNTASLLNELRNSYDERSRTLTEDVIAAYTNVDLLLIDDLGVQTSGKADWVNEQLYEILNIRYEQIRPIIITANYDLKGQLDHMGGGDVAERIHSRIIDMVELPAIHFPDTDLRIQMAANRVNPYSSYPAREEATASE